MTAQQLKNSILQMAVQGKLVPQDKNDEPASILLEHIKAEKQALIKAGKIKKEKPLAPITEDEIPFDIPESWEWCRLGTVFQHNTGKALNSSKPQGTRMQYITTSNLYWDRFVLDKLREMPFTDSEVDKCTVRKGDLLVCEGGDVGRAAIWNYDYPMRIQNHIHRLRPYTTVEVYFFYYVFYLYKKSGIIGGKGIGLQGLSSGVIDKLLIPLPPLYEQKRIVAKIEELLPYIEKYDKTETKLTELNTKFPDALKKSILQEAVQGKLVPQNPDDEPASVLLERIKAEKQKLIKEGKLKKDKPYVSITDEDIPFDIPENWCWCYIGEIAFVTKLAGFEYTESINPNLSNDGIPLFKGKNVQNGKLVLEFESYIPEQLSDELFRSQINKKCLLTPYVGTIGNIAIFDGSFKAHLGSNVGKIELLNPRKPVLIEEYVLYYLRSQFGYEQLTKHKKATAQESISIENIRNVIIPIPPLQEQKRIVAKIEELTKYCEML